jgi:hypothetical protein
MGFRKAVQLGLVMTATLAVAQSSNAGVIYSFDQITNNGSPDASGQLQVSVDEAGAGQVTFTFTNLGPVASSITDIYFDDGSLLSIASITDGAGVDFEPGASPGNLPGGTAIDFNATSGFTADSESPTQPNGVNPGETVTITFNLIAGQDYQDVIDALALAGDNPGVDVEGGLRIGIHVQGYEGGGSESFVNHVPDGGTTMSLLGFGLAALGAYARRKGQR